MCDGAQSNKPNQRHRTPKPFASKANSLLVTPFFVQPTTMILLSQNITILDSSLKMGHCDDRCASLIVEVRIYASSCQVAKAGWGPGRGGDMLH